MSVLYVSPEPLRKVREVQEELGLEAGRILLVRTEADQSFDTDEFPGTTEEGQIERAVLDQEPLAYGGWSRLAARIVLLAQHDTQISEVYSVVAADSSPELATVHDAAAVATHGLNYVRSRRGLPMLEHISYSPGHTEPESDVMVSAA